jgi:hypothetical protein
MVQWCSGAVVHTTVAVLARVCCAYRCLPVLPGSQAADMYLLRMKARHSLTHRASVHCRDMLAAALGKSAKRATKRITRVVSEAYPESEYNVNPTTAGAGARLWLGCLGCLACVACDAAHSSAATTLAFLWWVQAGYGYWLMMARCVYNGLGCSVPGY